MSSNPDIFSQSLSLQLTRNVSSLASLLFLNSIFFLQNPILVLDFVRSLAFSLAKPLQVTDVALSLRLTIKQDISRYLRARPFRSFLKRWTLQLSWAPRCRLFTKLLLNNVFVLFWNFSLFFFAFLLIFFLFFSFSFFNNTGSGKPRAARSDTDFRF